MVYGIALHTTSPELGIAISNFQDYTRFQTWEIGLDLATIFHQQLVNFLSPQTWQDLAFIAVAKGPGSFTSSRIGLVTARTLAQQLNIPLFAISTLKAATWSSDQAKNNESQLIAVEMEARRNQLFVAIYQSLPDHQGLETYLEDQAIAPENWQEILDQLTITYQRLKVTNNLGNHVTALLNLAYLDWQQGIRPSWQEALPFYGQHPVN
jgi:tRNA threonylcarbamoyl adenosine modification protein YeaZ